MPLFLVAKAENSVRASDARRREIYSFASGAKDIT